MGSSFYSSHQKIVDYIHQLRTGERPEVGKSMQTCCTWGIEHEDSACNRFYDVLKQLDQRFKDLVIYENSFFPHDKIFGGSPDGLICDKNRKIIATLELKCPAGFHYQPKTNDFRYAFPRPYEIHKPI